MKQYRVAMTVNDAVVDSSTVFSGTLSQCAACAKRLMAIPRHKQVGWIVLECAA